MKLLLAGILVLLPLTAQAEYSDDLRSNESDPNSVAEFFGAENPDDPDSATNKFGPYVNPYSPTSATNFEAITAPFLYDQGRLSASLYDPDWISHPFGRYGNPYSPNPNTRYGVGDPCAPGSTTNLYDRGWRTEGR